MASSYRTYFKKYNMRDGNCREQIRMSVYECIFKSMIDAIISKDYKIIKKLGAGAFGQVYKAQIINATQQQTFVAIKFQSRDQKSPSIYNQIKILREIQATESTTDYGLPIVHCSGSHGIYFYMVMDYLGRSLQILLQLCSRKLSQKTCLMLGYQMIERIQYLHNKGYVHRDVKSANFVMGIGKKANKLFLIDFGLAKKYLTDKGEHIPYKQNRPVCGTYRFLAVNTHLMIQSSRRDDLEGIGYLLVYLMKGNLPWMQLKGKKKSERLKQIAWLKINTPIQKLCEGIDQSVKNLLTYARNLQFEDQPNYQLIKMLFSDSMDQKGYAFDKKYEWSQQIEYLDDFVQQQDSQQ